MFVGWIFFIFLISLHSIWGINWWDLKGYRWYEWLGTIINSRIIHTFAWCEAESTTGWLVFWECPILRILPHVKCSTKPVTILVIHPTSYSIAELSGNNWLDRSISVHWALALQNMVLNYEEDFKGKHSETNTKRTGKGRNYKAFYKVWHLGYKWVMKLSQHLTGRSYHLDLNPFVKEQVGWVIILQ